MNSLNKYLESIRQYRLPGTRALQQELDGVLKAHAAVSADLETVRENLQLTHENDAQLLADLKQQVRRIESESSNAREQVEHLERSLADAEQRQNSTEEQVASLEAKLEGERRIARERVEYLERSLADAEQRQNSTEEGVTALEAMLEKEQSRHEESAQATETFLVRMQDEQQSLLKRQSELANNFQGVATLLQDSVQLDRNKPQHSLLKLTVTTGVLLATGTLAGVLFMQTLQDKKGELAMVKQDVHDMRVFMKQHLDNQYTVLNELTQALNRQTSSNLALVDITSLAYESKTPETDTQPQKAVTITSDIRELQASLMVLGFDLGISRPNGELGIKTRQALQEFRQFYLPDSDSQDDIVTEPLAALILSSADLARADAARFNIGSDVLAAIRLGSIRTGVDFSFLMEMARVESDFNPMARAPKSSATGLFQFKSPVWLQAMQMFGPSYGMQDIATQVALIDVNNPEQTPIVYDPLQQEVLALRFKPRLSTLFAAENIKRNLQALSGLIGREPGRTDLYLSHFLGTANAALFLKALDEEPTAIASERFPEVAASNPGVFQNRQQQPRTVAGVYKWFDRKFNTARYDNRNPG
jgi:peptidoglycan hydrolase-like protein with peptidoglycan-binding domain